MQRKAVTCSAKHAAKSINATWVVRVNVGKCGHWKNDSRRHWTLVWHLETSLLMFLWALVEAAGKMYIHEVNVQNCFGNIPILPLFFVKCQVLIRILLCSLFERWLVSGARQGQTPDMLSCDSFREKVSFVSPSWPMICRAFYMVDWCNSVLSSSVYQKALFHINTFEEIRYLDGFM